MCHRLDAPLICLVSRIGRTPRFRAVVWDNNSGDNLDTPPTSKEAGTRGHPCPGYVVHC